MATLGVKILPNRRKASGKLGIYISLTFKKEVRYISTTFEIDDEAEFENGRICYRKDAATLNKRIDFVLNEYKERLDKVNPQKFVNCSQLKEFITKVEFAETLTIQDLFNRRILRFEKEGRKSYARMNRDTVKAVISILGNPPIDYLTRLDIKNSPENFRHVAMQKEISRYE